MSKKPRTLSQRFNPCHRDSIKKKLVKYAGAEQGRSGVYDNYGYQAELASRLHRDWPNGQKQVYVSQSTLYDSWSNMPGEGEGSSHINCKRCFLVLGIILLISGIIAGIVLAIYFSQRDIGPPATTIGVTTPGKPTTQVPTTIPVPAKVEKKFTVQLKTKGNFTEGLKNPNSQEYKDKAKEIIDKVDKLYRNSSLKDKYNRTEVKGFSIPRNGSIVVNTEVYFITDPPAIPTPSAQNSTKKPTDEATISKETLKDIYDGGREELNLEVTDDNRIIISEIVTTAAPRTTVTVIVPTEPTSAPTTTVTERVTEKTITTTGEPPITSPNGCNPGLARCNNRQCIRQEWFCDEFRDCLDGSDEDDVRCGRDTTQPPNPQPKSNGKDLDCNFESKTKELCNYKISPGVFNWSVSKGQTSSNNTGPDYDHTFLNPDGRYLFTESSYGNYNDNATLTSVVVNTDNTDHSLTFFSHMYGANMGTLEVYFNVETGNGVKREQKWRESGNRGNMWLYACIVMPKNTTMSVEFVAYRGLNYTSDIAIDDIKYSTDTCKTVYCTYEEGTCGYNNLSTSGKTNSYDWRRVRGQDLDGNAPKVDYTLGKPWGTFMMADSSKGRQGDKATFTTPLIKDSRTVEPKTLNFRLNMAGSGLGSLRMNLVSFPFSATSSAVEETEITNGWKRICVVVPKGFVGIAEFEAVRGTGRSAVIAVDDVGFGPESDCQAFSTCRFEDGLFCNFDVIGQDYRWSRYCSLEVHYALAMGSGPEGTTTSLVSPAFKPLRNSSATFKYTIEGTSILSVFATVTTNGKKEEKKLWTTEGIRNGVQTTMSNTVDLHHWVTGCFNIPTGDTVVIKFVSRKIDRNGGGIVAVDWYQVHEKQCEIGLGYGPCNFEEPNICGYEIECSFNTQYKWKRVSGRTPTESTGPRRDHTFNSTSGNYLYTEGSVGRPGDKAVVTFEDVQTASKTSLRFHYYMSGQDIGSLYIVTNSDPNKIIWIQQGPKSPFWYFGCVDLPINQKINVSFYGIRGKGPLSDIAIDDVHLYDGKCPELTISCDFENEMMCGYIGLSNNRMRTDKSFTEQWWRTNGSSAILPQRDHTTNSSDGYFLYTMLPSRIMSPRIAYGQTTCLSFYYFIQMGKGQNINVTIDYAGSKQNKVKDFGTDGYSLARWRRGQMTVDPGNYSVIFSVGPYNQEISSTFFAIDDVSISFGKCSETVCQANMFKCVKDEICIPEYKKCDWVQDCSDGSDENNCLANMTTIRLIDGVTSGSQGRLEIYVNGSWGTAYSLRWFETNAKVACRQLGYSGYYKSVRFGKYFFGLGDVWQINCIGNETNLQDCDKTNVVYTIPHLYDVGLACYNTVCEPGKNVCPKVANSSVVYCLYDNQFCDGDFDCPGGEDEANCSNCRAGQFECKNHHCIPDSRRCDGKPDCDDASDEMNCIKRDPEGNVKLYYNNTWTPLCDYGSNDAFYSSLCLIMGQGAARRRTVHNSTDMGLVPSPSQQTMSAIGKYDLSYSKKACPLLKLQCYGQECGSRSQKMVVPFVQFGSQAVPTEYPWQVMLLRNGNFHCGASIFNSRWLITAEHCVVERYVKYEVVAGLLRMQDLDKFPRIQVIQIIHSMNYGNYKGIPINDIALILLEKDLQFNEYIQPVCLPSKVYESQDYCYLSGWGRDENLVGQSHLKETKVYAITSDECKKYYDNITDNSFICFRHNQPNMPSCYGDSGGPLVCRNDRGRFELVGVVSFGLPLCAASNGTPAAFTNVLNFRGWIVDQTRCKMWCPNGKCLYEAETCDGIDHCSDKSDESPPKCNPTVACNFGKAYKCGYKNDSVNPWYWSSPHWSTPYMKSKPLIGGDQETDEYMLASVNATKSSPAKLISPSAAEISCISFLYLANANNSAVTVLKLKAIGQNPSSSQVIWDNGKNNTQEQMSWKLATVSLPNTTTSLVFEAYYENPNPNSFIAIDSVKVLDKDCTVCAADQFQCNTGHCINSTAVCDGIQQCSDASDELNCFQPPNPGCSSDHFQCSNGECVLKDRKCNGLKDCKDGSDETNCTKPEGHCSWGQFRCNDGQCIEDYLRCDGVWHCKDGSDEIHCHRTTIAPEGNCKWNQFRCDDGTCIQSYFKCDGISHCRDSSDEKYCFRTSTQLPGICKWNQFRCSNGQCIDFHFKCDNIKQCRDGSDEQYCGDKTTIQPGGCTWDQFRCDNGQCIQAFLRCDRLWHCKDGSDEQNCPSNIPAHCRWDQFRCNDGNCIESHLKCDGESQCKDGSDERYCYRTSTAYPGPCQLSQFRCNNGQCIESFLKCDKVKHCKDGSDEQYCGATTIQPQGICRWDQFRCKDGQCIPYHHKCDQIWHCRDGTDEQNCPKPLIENKGCKYDEFGCLDGKCIEIILVCNDNKDCLNGEDEHNCTNTTQPIPTATPATIPMTTMYILATKIPVIKACAADEFRCDDKQCIPATFVCDIIPDCDNAKDEMGCDDNAPTKKATEANACLPNEFKCDQSQCIPNLFACDDIPDCDNGRDELECGEAATTLLPKTCQFHEFGCDNGQCIPKSKRCDSMSDCTDNSDEQNCGTTVAPAVTTPITMAATTTERTTKSPTTISLTTTTACRADEFRCDDKQCIPRTFVCDIIPDCDNGKDELNCGDMGTKTTAKTTVSKTTACRADEFRCSNSKCIPTTKRCDKRMDCFDGSDEKNCPSTTMPSTTDYTIKSTTVRPTTIKSTTVRPTTIKSTTMRPTTIKSTTVRPTTNGCLANQFQCANGKCIAKNLYCDRWDDCGDNSDENQCSKTTSKPKSTLKGCSYDDFGCDNGQCIPLSFHCDGLFDCNDKSDEKNCSQVKPTHPSIKGCDADEFRCNNGFCIKSAFVCDGLYDCPDSSDEQECPKSTSTQATTTTGPKNSIPPSDKCFPLEVKECLQVGYSRTLLPNVFGDKTYTQAMERFYTKAMPIINSQCSRKALMLLCGTIFPLCKNGISKYTCKSVCREVEQSCGKDSILLNTCDWLVDDSRWCFIGLLGNQNLQGQKPTEQPVPPEPQGCQKGYYQCKNSNLCLHPIHLCDGEPACPQADDEHENCTCQPNQFRCASGQCVMKSRRCNGYQDCKDYSDEHNCTVSECVGRLCKSGQCVHSNSFCDGVFDCDDLSDEKLCECNLPNRRCDNQVCLKADKWCNHEDDCGDNSDEKNCDCSVGELMCTDGKCIPMEWWCDGNRDCSDGKDEAHCQKKNNSSLAGNPTTTSKRTPTTITTTVPTTTTTTIVFPFKDNCRPDEFICTRGYKCIKRTRVCDMNWDCVDGEDEATCVSLRKEESTKNSTSLLTLTVQGQTSLVCSNNWSRDWATFICKYLRHKSVRKVDFVDPPPGTTAFQQVPSHQLEFPEKDFIKTIGTCETNKIVRMECNERICGTNRHYSIKYQDFIIGGDISRRYTWPWAVSLLYLGEPICGATLISERWLVTAAHCIVTGMWNRTKVPHYFSAILGEVDLFKGLNNGTRIPIDKIVFPGDMKLVVFNPDPDIALLRLKYPVQRVRQIEPICMPKLPKHDYGSTCYLAGWGGTHKPGEDRRRYANLLHEVRMIIRNESDCSTFRPQPNWEHNICAGYLESTITGCYGDNGGGLMCWEPDNRWTLVGILSRGRYNCAANSPNVFTKIGSMREWMVESMGWEDEEF